MAHLTPQKRAQFIELLSASGGNVTKSSAAIGITRARMYQVREEDKEFAAEWTKAVALGEEALEDEATRRAIDGTAKPVFYQGEQCGIIQEYSDTLLIFKLKALRPEKYRERHDVQLHGSVAFASDADLAAIAGAGRGNPASPKGGQT